MKAVVVRGEQSDLDEFIRIARSIGGQVYQGRGSRIRVLGYGSVPLTSGESVKVAILDEGGRSGPGGGDGHMSRRD